MKKITAAITAVGKYLPEYVLTNEILEEMVDTTSDWILTRTGIKERRILKGTGKGSSFMAIRAGNDLIAKSNLNPQEIDLVIIATATPDMKAASTAAFVATEIGATNAFSFDLESACSSFLYGMSVASTYIESGKYKKVLLIGSDMNSSFIDYTDRKTCIIFGDGAGAVLFEPNNEGFGLIDEYLRTDGSGRDFLKVEAGGSLYPPTHETIDQKKHFVHQEGKTVFKYAVSNMADAAEKLLVRNQLEKDEIDWLVAHQANKRIIDATASRFDLDESKVMMNIQKYGNTTSATLPLLLNDYESQLKKGDKLIFAAFGGGFSWGAIYLTWAYNTN
ncbi:MAG: beta-ketoacyl-ACP synthase III [Flavobacteriaceae bacterium]|nr:beta-ketoacyl-ACP synthase III [Flavobacteriaceae bacterium]